MNQLGSETSPYLLQHRDNPVHWMPWGETAFAQAKATDRPVLLSVGYAACHWCHVMAHESFEDPQTAALMNANFINIKVDREERPDVDRIYMEALHSLGEQGGWPLTMFLTPAGEPFWGGTYFPPETRYGRPSFRHVLTEIARIWRDERDKVTTNATALRAALTQPRQQAPDELDALFLQHAANAYLGAVDFSHGGFRGAPKFPQAPVFHFLHAQYRRTGEPRLLDAVTKTLTEISQGGIYDHLGGGIARYSVDGNWLVPHFEKMLYDNAQYLSLLARAYISTNEPLYAVRAAETVDFLLRDMVTADGAFAASYDADSEGEEGRYYVWSYDELKALIPPADFTLFANTYNATPIGNWEGHIILNRTQGPKLLDPESESRLATSRAMLLEQRKTRIPPGFDDKVLADWNGLAIAALADASRVFERPDWLAAAERAFDRIVELLWTGDALHHSWRQGIAKHHATADAYANLIAGALALHAATTKPAYLHWAEKLELALVTHHWSADRGGFYFASDQAAELLVRPFSAHDDAMPNANGVMIGNLARLAHLTGKPEYADRAEIIHRTFAAEVRSNPFGYASFMAGLLDLIDPVQLVFSGSGDIAELQRVAISLLGPDTIAQAIADTAQLSPAHPAYGKSVASRNSTAYLCRGNVCAAPARNATELAAATQLLQLDRGVRTAH
ncbi:MAG: thioredoxin domain-containing protein [Hyphomicrobiales bacterium]